MAISVVPHDPNWNTAFTTEAAAIEAALSPVNITLHHIGSTAVPGILAKPIIDIMGAVATLQDIDTQCAAIEALGYQALGEFGIKGRRYFRKVTCDGVRTHHLHIYAAGSAHLARHLAFRDYLRAHPTVAAEYSALKQRLTGSGDATWDGYIDGKDPFVQRTQDKALRWYQAL